MAAFAPKLMLPAAAALAYILGAACVVYRPRSYVYLDIDIAQIGELRCWSSRHRHRTDR